ncbi:MAG TPA: hypothetical protein VMZ53_11680, partial [Kofleriaceae bacterium]|nr:hypothetical protein [Kofleriaceae bacterium]
MKTYVLALVVAMGCGGSSYDPSIDPAHFVSGVDNPLFPLVPGTVFQYRVQETGEEVTVTVTADTKLVMGVPCVVVRDTARSGGQIVEDTYDWYAQDDQGTVWYMGEDTTAYDGGMTSKEGSWQGGVDGALPGKIIPGSPHVGDTYRQEYYEDEAEDMGQILALDASITVPAGSYVGCLQTRDFSALEPEIEENKWYCPGVGQV